MTSTETLIVEALRFAQAAERIRALMATVKFVGEELAALAEVDDGLGPELLVTLRHLAAATEALGRAHDFAGARLDARVGAYPTPPADSL